MKPFVISLLLLTFACRVYNGVAKCYIVEVFAGQNFQSEVCTAENGTSPNWSINATQLINKDIIRSFNAHVERNPLNGSRQATLILYEVSVAFNGSKLSCSTNLTPDKRCYTLIVVRTTVKWLDINEIFHPEICTSPLPNSPSPYWSIDGLPLVNVSDRWRYGARVNYFNDIYGRYQADLTMSVNETFNGSNVSCIVASELGRVYMLGRVYILRINPPGEERPSAGTMETTLEAVTVVSAVGAETSNKTVRNTAIGVVLFAVVAVLAILGVAVCVVCRKKCLYRAFDMFKTTANDAEKNKTPHEKLDDSTRPDPYPTGSTVQEESFDPTSSHTRKCPAGGQDYHPLLPTSSTQRCGEGGEIVGNEGVQDIKHLVQNVSAERHRDEECGDTDRGVPEVSCGQGHGAAIVIKDTLQLQGMPSAPLKTYLTEHELSRTRTSEVSM